MKSSERRRERERADATFAVVNSALASGHARTDGDERERELGALALTLRAGAPEPPPAFAARLDERVASHFADAPADGASTVRGEGSTRRLGTVGMSRRQAVGALATVMLALLVGVGLLTGAGVLGGGDVSTTTEDGRGTTAPGSGAEPSVIRPGADEPSTQRAPVAPESSSGTDGFAPGERHVERTASLTLAAPEERLDRVADGVVAVTDRHRGHVVSSSTFSGEDEPAGGSFDLRVPTGELSATLSDLAVLGTLRSQAQTGDDLTQPVASASDRLDAARAERRGLLRRLERADTDREASALRRQLELVAGEIRGLRRQLAALRQRTDYARVSVTLTDESSTLGAGAGSTTGAALDDALGSLVAAFNLAIRALGVLIPLVLVAGLTWLPVSTVQRRRREAVLG